MYTCNGGIYTLSFWRHQLKSKTQDSNDLLAIFSVFPHITRKGTIFYTSAKNVSAFFFAEASNFQYNTEKKQEAAFAGFSSHLITNLSVFNFVFLDLNDQHFYPKI
jgi:hypothetical protein